MGRSQQQPFGLIAEFSQRLHVPDYVADDDEADGSGEGGGKLHPNSSCVKFVPGYNSREHIANRIR